MPSLLDCGSGQGGGGRGGMRHQITVLFLSSWSSKPTQTFLTTTWKILTLFPELIDVFGRRSREK